MKKTKFYNKVQRDWVLIDAKDKVLGRLATRIAKILQGKHKGSYSPNFLCGDIVVVINAASIKITGKKMSDKVYDKYSGYPSGRKVIPFDKLMEKNPAKALHLAVKGMLPKNVLAKQMIRSLKVYPQEQHPHGAHSPKSIEV